MALKQDDRQMCKDMKLIRRTISLLRITTVLSALTVACHAPIKETKYVVELSQPLEKQPISQASQRSADDFFSDGFTQLNSQDYKGAIDSFNQAIHINPNDAIAHYYRGISRTEIGDKQGATEDYRKAADIYQKQGKMVDYQNTVKLIKELQQR